MNVLSFRIITEQGKQQAKGKAETVTYIFWDASYACSDSEWVCWHLRTRGLVGSVLFAFLPLGDSERTKLLPHLPVLLGDTQNTEMALLDETAKPDSCLIQWPIMNV